MIKLVVIDCLEKKRENLKLILNRLERARAARLNWIVYMCKLIVKSFIFFEKIIKYE